MEKISIDGDVVTVKSKLFKCPVSPNLFPAVISELNGILDDVLAVNDTFAVVIDQRNVRMSEFDGELFKVICTEIQKKEYAFDRLRECRIINLSNSIRTLVDVFSKFLPRQIRQKLTID